MLHHFAFALVRHKVLLRASGFADETKFTVTNATKSPVILIREKVNLYMFESVINTRVLEGLRVFAFVNATKNPVESFAVKNFFVFCSKT